MLVRSRPLLSQSALATATSSPAEHPQMSATISGVYRAKCLLSSWNTHRGCWSVGSFLMVPPSAGAVLSPFLLVWVVAPPIRP